MTIYGTYQKDDGGREKYYPKNSHHGDCVIRACAIATGLDYYQTFQELTDIGLEVGDLANSPQVYPVFLERHGFKKQKTPRNAIKDLSLRAEMFGCQSLLQDIAETGKVLKLSDGSSITLLAAIHSNTLT